MELELIAITKDENLNVILGQTHFIKSVEDIYEAGGERRARREVRARIQ